MSSNFCDGLICTFFHGHFHFAKYQIRNNHTPVTVCYKKLFKSPKMADANKKIIYISPIFANFVALKNPPDIQYSIHGILYFGALKLLKYYKQGKVLCKCFILAQTLSA